MKKHTLVAPVRKLVLEKKTIMKLNVSMMRKLEAGYNTTSGKGGDSNNCTNSCVGCGTMEDCYSRTC